MIRFPVGGLILLVICVKVSLSASSVTWRKNNVEIRSDAFHAVRAEGERHSLALRQMRPSDAGSYCVTAVNAAGRASCSAALSVQSGGRWEDTPAKNTQKGDLLLDSGHIYKRTFK